MLEGEALEKAIRAVLKQLGVVNTLYIKKIAAQIKRIGELNPSSVNRLVAMSEMNADLGEITEQLRLAIGASNRVIRVIYEQALSEMQNDPRFEAYLSENPDAIRPEAQQRLSQYTQALWQQTAGNLTNYSNTTAVTMRQRYVDTIDRAILATSTGVGSYTETMRDTIRQLGQAGMQITYASGYHRRLDTAVRQNIVDGVNQINKNASVMIGQELGYDAIEISAHARSAPDHEPVQGRVFLLAEFQMMQAGSPFRDVDGRQYPGFKRPIGEWNCRHTPLSFSTKYSKRTWTDEQLQKFIDDNQKGCVINGKHRTLYEAMQMMRDIETQVRREKDTAVAAQAAGDNVLRQECQRNINALVRRYADIAKASGNAEKRQRMTVEGFRAVKAKPTVSERGISGKRAIATEENSVNTEMLKTPEYRAKFQGITGIPAVDQQLYKQAVAQLTHRNGTYGEDLTLINGTTGAVEGRQSQSATENGVDYNASLNKAIERSPEYSLISIHNHGTNNPPTGSDLVANGSRKYKLGVVVTHNGRVFTYRAGEKPFLANSFDSRVDKLRGKGYNEFDAIVEALNQYKAEYGIEWSER